MIRRFAQFSLRDVIYVTTIVALVLALWLTWQKLPEPTRPGSLPAGGRQTTIAGPLIVRYTEQTRPNSTSSSSDLSMRALHFMEDAVVFEYDNGTFRYIEKSRLVHLSWRAAE